MYLDLRAYLLVSKYHQANFTSHCIYSESTFCAKHMTFKVHGQTLIRHLPRMVRIKKDVIARCLTHKSKCVIYLTVGDQCRVFLLHRMYERVDTAVVIWCWTSGYIDGLCWKFFFTFSLTMLPIHVLLYCNQCWNCHRKFHQ